MNAMEDANVVALRNRMSEADYERERQHLRDTYGDNSVEAAAKRDQAMAILFYRSGWTQEELAQKEGKTRQWLAYRLRFGRFLNFATTVANAEALPANLSERKFRQFWDAADKMDGNERQRFAAVMKAMRATPITAPRRDPIGDAIKSKFADGKWHAPETVAKAIDGDLAHVAETLSRICRNKTYGLRGEHKRVGKSTHFRLFPQQRLISSDEISAKLRPLIDGLKQEGKKNMVTMSPGTVARLAVLLERQLDEWAQDTAADAASREKKLMSAFTLVSSEVQELTPELARQFYDMKPTPTERPLDPNRVAYLKEKIESGLAVPFHLAKVAVKATGETIRGNGQHTSKTLVEMGEKVPKGLKAHVDHYEVPDMHGAVLLFRQIDDRRSSRSARDVSGVYQGVIHNLEKIDRKVAKLGVDGVGWWRRTIEAVPVPSGDDIYSLFNETGLHGFLIWLGETINDMKTRELMVTPVVAAMYATSIAGEEMSRKFWHEVARGGVEYEEGHPTTVLDEWLKKVKTDADLKVGPGQMYQGCVYAWNAFRDDKAIKDIKYDIKKGFLKVA